MTLRALRKLTKVFSTLEMRAPLCCNSWRLNITFDRQSSWYRKAPTTSQFVADLEGESYKTTVEILNQNQDYLFVDSYSPIGFKLNNGVRILGPVALFPKTSLHWNVSDVEDVNMDSLMLYTVLEPKIDLLIIGAGEARDLKHIDRGLYKDLKAKGISLEILTTHQACATFNFLNGERRCIAAALLPPKKVYKRDMSDFLLPDDLNSIGLLDKNPNPNIDPETGLLAGDTSDDSREKK